MLRLAIGVLSMSLLVAACSGTTEDTTVASTIAEPTTTAAPVTTTSTTTTAVSATTTTITTTQPQKELTIALKVTTEEDGVAEVWSIAVDGGVPQRLLTNAERPAFSPDGQSLAFVELGDRESAVAVLDLDSGETTRLTDPAERGTAPSWSTDGSQIAYTAGTANLDIWVVDALGGEPRQLTKDPDREWWPCWTGAGEIAYARFSADSLHDIWVVDLVGGSTAPLVESPVDNWWLGLPADPITCPSPRLTPGSRRTRRPT